MVWLAIPTDRYDSTQRRQLLDDIERRMARIPGVVTVGAIDNILLNPLSQQGKRIRVPGVTPPKGQTAFEIDFAAADSGLSRRDRRHRRSRPRHHGGRRARRAARRRDQSRRWRNKFWPGKDAVGQTFSTDSVTYQVVGVTRTTKVRTLGEEPRPFIFTSFAQEFASTVMLVARTNGDADRTATQMLATLREVDPGIMAIQVKTMSAPSRRDAAARAPRRDGIHALRRRSRSRSPCSASTEW